MGSRTAAERVPAGRRAPGPAAAILALALVAAALLLAAELTTIASVQIEGESCEAVNDANPELADRCALSGWERHGGALVLLALVAAGAGVAARTGATTTGGGVLVAIGLVTLGLTLIGDLPVTNETGPIGLDFESATARAGLGFYLELTGGVLCLAAGALALTGGRRQPSPAPAEPRR